MTFINIASTTSDPEKSARMVGLALKALAEIHRGLLDPDYHGLSEYEIVFLKERCAEIDLALGG